MSSTIRQIVGLQYSGFSSAEIERIIGKAPLYVNKLEIQKPKSFQIAKEELIKSAVTEYETNLAFTRAALSESGFLAVDTLTGVMKNKDAKVSEQLKAADLTLKLLFGGGSAHPGEVAGEIISSFGNALAQISKASKRDDSYIIDDSEVIDVEADTLAD